MKKLLSWLLLLSLLLTLNGCVLAAEAEKIVIWHCLSDKAGQIMNDLIRDFNETVGKEMGVVAEPVFQGAYTDATTKMNNILSSDEDQIALLPDVMQLDATGKVNYLSSGVAYTIDQARQDDPDFDAACAALIPVAMGNWNLSGVQLGVPFATSSTVLYYNGSLIQKAPETLQDIAALAGTLPEGVTLYADLPNTASLANWLGQMGSDLVDHRNGTESSAEKLDCLENGALSRFLTVWKELYASGALSNAAGSQDAFAAGQAALLTASSSKLATLMEKTKGAFELGVAYFPRVLPDASAGSTPSGSCLVLFDKGNENKKAAARLLTMYLTSAPAQARLAAGTGYIPAHQEAAQQEAYQALIREYPQYQVALSQLMDTPAAMRSVTVGPSMDFYYAIQNQVSDMLSNDQSVEDTVDMMADELNGLLYQYNRANQTAK